jgi:transposase
MLSLAILGIVTLCMSSHTMVTSMFCVSRKGVLTPCSPRWLTAILERSGAGCSGSLPPSPESQASKSLARPEARYACRIGRRSLRSRRATLFTRSDTDREEKLCFGGIFWVLRSGAPWRDLPDDFGPYTTCYNRFVRWRRAGVWSCIMNALAAAHDASVQMIDTSIVQVHQHGACIVRNRRQSMGRSRGGLTSKIHAVVDTNGLPVRLALTAGEAHDNRLADKLLSRLKSGSLLLADRGYDADWIRALAARKGALANIPPRCNRTEPICFSPYLYRARHSVERFFNKIKHCRRIATRYDKLAANYLAFVQLASIRLWLRVNESASLVTAGTRISVFRFVIRPRRPHRGR